MKLFNWLNEDSPSGSSDTAEPDSRSSLRLRLNELKDKKATDLMVARALVSALDAEVQLRRVRRLKSSKASFFLVYKGDLDRIIGWITKAKVLELINETGEDSSIALHVRPIGYVTEEASVADVADVMAGTGSPFVVVRNEVGSTLGTLTVYDVVEQLFGIELNPAAAPSLSEPGALRGYEL